MSKRSTDFRNRAARELRESRNGGTPEEKAGNKKRAASLKKLSENEEWLDGEKQRPSTPEELNQGGAQKKEMQPPEQAGSFKPLKQKAGPYDRDKESGGKLDEQGLPADDSKFG
jgi:hypothetical protein